MHSQPSSESLRARLRAYPRSLADLSRVRAPEAMWVALATSSLPPMVRTARIVFTTVHGTLSVLIDAARFPALDSIALDTNEGRRIALANLYLEPWLEPIRRSGITGLAVASITPLFAPAATSSVTPPATATSPAESSTAAPFTELERSAASVRSRDHGLPVALGAPALPCVVDDISAALVQAIAAITRGAVAPSSPAAHRHLAALHALPLQGRLRIATRPFRIDTLTSLRTGDVLLGWPLREPYRSGAPLDGLGVWWGAPGGLQCLASARIDGTRVTLKGPFTMTHDTLDYPTDTPDLTEENGAAGSAAASDSDAEASAAPPALPPRALDAMALSVHLEIATLELPLSTLASMHAGYVLELPVPIEAASIRLVACGRTIGTGQLVAVGDNLGVRISELATGNER